MDRKINQKSRRGLPRNPEGELPPLLYAAQSKAEESRLAALKKSKRIRKIGPRLYTSLPKNDTEAFVRANWAQIVSHLYPDSLLSHRSALEYKPSADGRIILTANTNREVRYPGLVLEFVRGPHAREDDSRFFSFHVASPARALLEVFNTDSRTRHRALPIEQVEERLLNILNAKGEDEINRLREHARAIAKDLKLERAFQKLNPLISAIMGSKPGYPVKSPVAKGRVAEQPYDAIRTSRFDVLLNALRSTPLKENREIYNGPEHIKNKAFFEAYFSNYIEGTTFEIEEAEEIVFDHKIPEKRPKDAHDILGTYELVSDLTEMRKTPTSAGELLDLLIRRHMVLMKNRPEAQPGEFKDRPNRAGDSRFVLPDEVEGTLAQGFLRYEQVPEGLARAIFIMFLVAEVHPFVDGNGRIARVMMNAEMHRHGLSTIIIPNVYREDYLGGLRALTRRDRPDPLIRMVARAHQFSFLEFQPYSQILKELEQRHWFREPADAKIVE